MKYTMYMAFPDRPRMRCFEKLLLTHSWNRRKGENNVPRNIKHKALYNCITFSLQSSLKNLKMCLSIKKYNLQQCWWVFFKMSKRRELFQWYFCFHFLIMTSKFLCKLCFQIFVTITSRNRSTKLNVQKVT